MFSTLLSFASSIKYIGYILIAILVLLFMVLIHELGHYLAGKMLKFKINEFSVGFGPKIFQKRNKSGELISLRAFPLGGYCAFEGETDDGKDNPHAFSKQKPWKRLIVLFAGAFFNFISGIIFSFILLVSSGYDLVKVDKINSQSINYGVLQQGDVIYGINNTDIDYFHDDYLNTLTITYLKDNYSTYEGEITEEVINTYKDGDETFYLVKRPITLNVLRDKQELTLVGYVNASYNAQGELKGATWLTNYNSPTEEFNLENHRYGFFKALGEATPFACKWSWEVLVVFGKLITGQLAITNLGGPVTTVNMIANFTSQNMLLILLPLIAVNLAVFNLLPIPALDGFQMVFVTIEWIRKKPIKQEIINIINNVGLIVLFAFVILVDVLQFVL